MNEHYLRNVIEAALLAAGRPVQPAELIQLFDESARPTTEQMRAAIDALAAEYAERGIELKETASGVRIQVRRELAGEVSRLWPERPARYSRALLETLALIAYRQPITRGEIEGVRGVAVNPNIVKTLLERNWVRVVGTRDVPGRPELLGTTRDFLDYFGLKSLDELPPLSELKAVGDINLQLDLQGAAAQPAQTDGESAPDAASPPEGAASETDASEAATSEAAIFGATASGTAESETGASDAETFDADAAGLAASEAVASEAVAFEAAVLEDAQFDTEPEIGESEVAESVSEFEADESGIGASAETAAESAAASVDAISVSDASTTTAAEPPSDEALLEGTAGTDESAVHGAEKTPDDGVDEAVDDEDEGEEGDELSAEGGNSHELVAAPRDGGD